MGAAVSAGLKTGDSATACTLNTQTPILRGHLSPQARPRQHFIPGCVPTGGHNTQSSSGGGPGKQTGASRAQFIVWLARALNGGTDPTDTGSVPGIFGSLDTTAAWYPHFYYLYSHPNIPDRALKYNGWFGGFGAFQPNHEASVFYAAHLIRYAFEIEQNITNPLGWYAQNQAIYNGYPFNQHDGDVQGISSQAPLPGHSALWHNDRHPRLYPSCKL